MRLQSSVPVAMPMSDLNHSAPLVLSVIVPAYNEEVLLEDTVRGFHKSLDSLAVPAEIIVVNDGSRDRTGAIADQLSGELPGVITCHQENQGVGGACRTGAQRASGEYVILWPADMPMLPADLEPYSRQFGRADVIIGVRRARLGYSVLMRLNAWVYRRLVMMLFGLNVRDVNWIQAWRRKLFLDVRLTQRGIPMLAETLVRLRDAGATFVEVDVEMKARSAGVSSASRVPVMVHTLRGLLGFWWTWRREPRGMAMKARRSGDPASA